MSPLWTALLVWTPAFAAVQGLAWGLLFALIGGPDWAARLLSGLRAGAIAALGTLAAVYGLALIGWLLDL
jgi:hypothetical protein